MRGRLDGTGLFLGIAGAFAVFGVLAFLLVIQQPSWVQWSGVKVHAVTIDGQTSYTYRGEQYQVDNPAAADEKGRHPTTVWLSRGDPTNSAKAYVDSPSNRWLDFSLVMVWFAVGIGIATYGVVRRLRRW